MRREKQKNIQIFGLARLRLVEQQWPWQDQDHKGWAGSFIGLFYSRHGVM
uniref:Uncharacterized protein n=1 Tax=Arundo donax TaxID=35708 RepID=A0A0A9HH73_ARUDO